MSTYLRRFPVAALSLLAVALMACDTGTDPVATATVRITAYIDVNSSLGNDAGDEPVQGATITLTLVGAGSGNSTTTDAMGVATFTDVEVGSYTASIELPGSVTGVTLASASNPTVVAEEDVTVTEEFRYTYNPGSIDGHVFMGSGSYTAGDPVVPDVDVTISQGGIEINTVTTDETGAFSAGGLLPGDYDVELTVPPYLTTTAASQTVTVTADQAATADFGMDPNATHTIAEARAAAADDTVSIIGVAIAGNSGTEAVFSSSTFYMQDASGISIFLSGVSASVELGDSVLVYGIRGSFSNEVQLSSLAVLVLGQGTLPTPTTATAAELNGNMYQGQLVTIQDVVVDSIPGSSNTSGEIWVSEFTTGEDLALYIDSDVGIDIGATFTVGNAYDVTGVMSRYFDLFELKPRMPADVATEDLSGVMTIADARAAATNDPVSVTGVVTEPGTLEGNGFYIEDATAGIFVFTGAAGLPALSIGDVVTVEGDRTQFFNIAQIGGTVTVTPVRTASEPMPTPVTIPVMNSGDVQGQLVQLTDVTLDSIGSTSGSGVTLYVTNATNDTAEVRLDVDSNLTAAGFSVGEVYTFAGVVSNFNVEQLKPRFPEDATGFMPVDTLRTVAEARAAEDGVPVELTGVVTVSEGTYADRNAYMQDATAGILIRLPVGDTVAVGDSVTVTGSRGSFASELQVNVDTFTVHGAGTVPAPRVITPADLEGGLYQGELAILQGVTVSAINGQEVSVHDGQDTTIVYVDVTTGIDVNTAFTVGSSYDVTGAVSRFNDTFELKPRDDADIVGL